MRRRTISVFLSLMLCLSLLSACGTTTDVPINGSNRDIAFEETQQEESAEGSDSTTSVWGDRIFEKCGIRRDEEGDGGKTLEIRGKRRLSARDGGANYQQS